MEHTNFNERQRARAKACSTPEELLALAREEGLELSDDELDQVCGAWGAEAQAPKLKCPSCQGTDLEPQGMHSYRCRSCQNVFKA